MFDIVDGFRTKGSGAVTKKHFIRLAACFTSALILTASIRYMLDKDVLLPYGAEFNGTLSALALLLVADYLREVIRLGKNKNRVNS